MINWGLVSHPLNWITVTLMVLIAGIGLHLILSYQVDPMHPLSVNKQ